MIHDPYQYFRIEGREIVDELGKDVLSLEKGGREPELIGRMFRLAHTLKGAARVVKQPEIADHAHAIEDALSSFREGERVATREQIDGVLHLLDAIGARVTALVPPSAKEKPKTQNPAPQEPLRALRGDVAEMDALLDGVTEVGVQVAGLRRAAGSLGRVRHLAGLLGDQLSARKTLGPGSGVLQKARSIADELHGLVSRVERDLADALAQTDRELAQAREAAERLRLLPAGLMFTSLERATRDVGVSLGKRVAFESKGGEVRLDADMLGVAQSAMVQAVRNAVAHGIETELERTSRGKPREGKVVVEVVRRGNRISFTCRDDGRGVDLDAVRRAAHRRGTLSPDHEVGSEELLRLLLKGGISTSQGVTEVSGRGVGLDVIRATADSLGGKVDIRTKVNEGTELEIVVPVSLSSVDALVVETEGQMAAIPLDSVRQTLRLEPADVTHTAGGDAIVVEGKVIPFAPLARSFRRSAPVGAARRWSAVVIASHGALAAVGVDRLVGTETVVLRPLPNLTPASAAVCGASLDAEGNPRMVLDPDGLMAELRRTDTNPVMSPPDRSAILVIDDSLTTRMLEQSILESAGYEVDLATSGEEGLEKARKRSYGLFLVDVEMPGMDGFTFVERSRSDPALARVPAILVTSRSAPEDRERGLAAGASAYIVKGDFDQTDLLARIRKLLQ